MLLHLRSLVQEFNATPIPGVSLSAGGLLALADLQTVAQRTALTGGSSWLDAFVLAPGLHYQQAADSLIHEAAGPRERTAVENRGGGRTASFPVANAATVNFMQRVAAKSGRRTITVDVGLQPTSGLGRRRRRRGRAGREDGLYDGEGEGLDWASHVLYLASPFFTVAAIVFTVLLEDWWCLATIIALMVARILNIYIIKQRSRPRTTPPPNARTLAANPDANTLTEYYVDVGHGAIVRLRGMTSDLQAITRESWLRNKTFIQGYLEACAKLIVYMVAALSGNLTQAGAIILMAMLLASSALLALSNSHATKFLMHGRVAQPTPESDETSDESGGAGPPYPDGRGEWPESSNTTTTSGRSALDDWAEKGQRGHPVRDSYPFDDRVNYN